MLLKEILEKGRKMKDLVILYELDSEGIEHRGVAGELLKTATL